MKKFDILRYLRRFFALVLAVTMAGTVVVYWYCKNNQTYTASVNIKYLHDGIKDGFAPDGTAMNVDEIYSSKVILIELIQVEEQRLAHRLKHLPFF